MNRDRAGTDERLPAPPMSSELAFRADVEADIEALDDDQAGGAAEALRQILRRPAVLLGIGVALLLAAVTATAFVLLRGSSADLLSWVPSDAEVAAVVHLDPGAGQKVNLARLADAVPDSTGPDDVAERLEEWGDDALQDLGLRFDDVTAWLGVEVALVGDVDQDATTIALLAHVEERDGAELMLAKLQAPGAPWEGAQWRERDYLGVTLTIPTDDASGLPSYAFEDDVLIVASDPALIERVLETHQGLRPSVLASAPYQESQAELPTSTLVSAFVHVGALADTVEPSGPAGAASAVGGFGDLEAIRSVGVALTAEPDGLALDVVASFDAANLTGAVREQVEAGDHENLLLRSVPERAWGVFAAEHVDLSIESILDRLRAEHPRHPSGPDAARLTGAGGLVDLLTGDLAVAFAPDAHGAVGGAMLLGVTDDRAARPVVDRLAETVADELVGSRARHRNPGWQRIAHPGGTIITFLPRAPIAYAIEEGVVILGTSRGQVRSVLDTTPATSLVSDPAYTGGTRGVPTTDALFYADLGRAITTIRDALGAEDRASWDPELARHLRTVRSVAFGVDANTDRQRLRLFLAIPTEDERSAQLRIDGSSGPEQ